MSSACCLLLVACRPLRQQLIPGPTGDDQLLHYGAPIGPGISQRQTVCDLAAAAR